MGPPRETVAAGRQNKQFGRYPPAGQDATQLQSIPNNKAVEVQANIGAFVELMAQIFHRSLFFKAVKAQAIHGISCYTTQPRGVAL